MSPHRGPPTALILQCGPSAASMRSLADIRRRLSDVRFTPLLLFRSDVHALKALRVDRLLHDAAMFCFVNDRRECSLRCG